MQVNHHGPSLLSRLSKSQRKHQNHYVKRVEEIKNLAISDFKKSEEARSTSTAQMEVDSDAPLRGGTTMNSVTTTVTTLKGAEPITNSRTTTTDGLTTSLLNKDELSVYNSMIKDMDVVDLATADNVPLTLQNRPRTPLLPIESDEPFLSDGEGGFIQY